MRFILTSVTIWIPKSIKNKCKEKKQTLVSNLYLLIYCKTKCNNNRHKSKSCKYFFK